MEQIYALGISCIELVQYWFKDYERYFELVNQMSDPHNIIEILFPLISILDSVFATQLIFVMAFGGWLNSIIKWWLLEDRPYWWVQETTFYKSDKPYLMQTRQTCMTGPGNPSGHTTAAASVLILVIMWISHIINDRKWTVWWWKHITFPLFGFSIVSVILARMFVATHFPHQCFFGALLGLFLSPALCIYVTDPYIWRYGPHVNMTTKMASFWHITSAVAAILIGVVTYYSLILCGLDPHYTVKLAFRWCEIPDSIKVSSTPMFGIVLYTANLLGLALSATPDVAMYRHYTKNRSLIISIFATVASMYGFKQLEENVTKTSLFLSPALCIYVTDPYIWRYGPHVNMTTKMASFWHITSAVAAILIGVVTYYSLILCGLDPHYTVKLAFRWCEIPDSIKVSSTPMFGIVLYTANLLGLALSATPDVAMYRHYTKNRSLIISIFATVASIYGFKQLEENVTKTSAFRFYSLHFILNVIKPGFLLRFIPVLSMWPYGKEKIQ